MTAITLEAVGAVLLLVLVHVVTPSLRLLEGTPRSAWLSIAGGVSVAYVFVHLLPELAAGEEAIGRAAGDRTFAEHHVYLIALIGLAAFYGLDRMAKNSRSRRQGAPVRDGRAAEEQNASTGWGVFWIHIGSFSVYNALIGYLLLHRELMTAGALAFFAVAMALHFVVTDYGLNEDHKAAYLRFGRWVLILAVMAGFGIGLATELSKAAIAVLTGFLAGGVILNVLKEEVPSERESRFWAFAIGMAGYAGLLLTL
jgi:hypothetical protein